MTTTRDEKIWSQHSLPVELWFEILSRLPSKSLLRLRGVSKSWKSLIGDPNFCRLHLNNFTNNRLETHFFVTQRKSDEKSCVVRNSNTFKIKARLDFLDTVYRCSGRWKVLCAMDGLVMIRNYSSTPGLILWNPSIRKARSLPPFLSIPERPEDVDYDIGFDPMTNDYKVVRFVKRGYGNFDLDAIYTLGTSLWKTVEYEREQLLGWCWSFSDACNRICFRGALYFTAFNMDAYGYELVLFDLSNEVFASISLPEDDDIKSRGYLKITLVDGGRSLGLVFTIPTQASVWVLESSAGVDTDSPCWTKRFVFASRIPSLYPYEGTMCQFLYLKKNGDMLLHWRRFVTSYNPERNEEKTLLRNGHGLYMVSVHCYIESLLLLNG